MQLVLGLIESTVFILLAALHFQWALGGTWGFEHSIPEKEDGGKVMQPKKTDSAIVGVGLLLFATYYLLKIGLFPVGIPQWFMNYGGWIVSGLFLLRAIGEFRYVGFFKKVKHTTFAQRDTKYYSPLCLVIGVTGILIEWL